jgi:anti-anti-sigma factor
MAGHESLIHCRVAAVPGGHRVTVTGEVDMQTAPRLIEALLQFANGSVTVDLTNVTFLDSAGLHALECAHQQIRRRNARLVVDAVSTQARRTLELTGLATLPPFDTASTDHEPIHIHETDAPTP